MAVAVIALLAVFALRGLNSSSKTVTRPSASPSPSPQLHSKEAVIAAVREYYRVTDFARQNGNADLVDQVTTDRGAPANINFREFLREQSAKNRLGVVTQEYFNGWSVQLEATQATVTYVEWLSGYDIDATTKQPVEAENTTTKGRYQAVIRLTSSGSWAIETRDLLADNVP